MNSTMQRAVEVEREPDIRIHRNLYNFLVQTKYLSESQVYAEAYLRGLITGRHQEVISVENRKIIDEQMRTDYQRFKSSGVDLTPIIMEFRPTPSESSTVINEMCTELKRLEDSGADIAALGAQIEFGINVLKRTNFTRLVNIDTLQQTIEFFNEKYAELSLLQHPIDVPLVDNNQYQQTQQNQQSQGQFFSPINRTYQRRINVPHNSDARNLNNSTQYYTPRQTIAQQYGESSSNYNARSPTGVYNPQRLCGNNTSNSILSGRQYSILAGPHRVSATIINILSKNVYNVDMDAIDQIETWENQAQRMQVPTDYFLSYMEVLLSQDMQSWWSLNRGKLDSWLKFKLQFLEDFGDNNRAIKAEQELANLAQGDNESFQQLYLRFTKLMKHIKPEKSPADKLYSLKASLKPEVRAACLTAPTIADLKRICQEFEGMEKVNLARKRQFKANKVNMLESCSAMEVDDKPIDYGNNELNWNELIEEEERAFVSEENLEKRKTAMSQKWTKEQRKEWLSKQLCFNCDTKGHFQSQCDKPWKPHCAKCGNKNANNIKECNICSGNANSSIQNGA